MERGASAAGRPYLARCSEEHGGPHETWFWNASLQGGGALNDMLCHSIEASRFILTAPHEEEKLVPCALSAEIATLKWSRKEYADKLMKASKGQIDYSKKPAEDWGRANMVYETHDGLLLIADLSTSWSFVPGERIFIEIIGPEYYMQIDTLNSEMKTFFSREIKAAIGDFVEKQTAEQGFMPVLPEETSLDGYVNENLHMVESFRERKMPKENWNDGLLVVKLLMACYMSAEKGRKLTFPPHGLEDFIPKVAQGAWKPADAINAPPE